MRLRTLLPASIATLSIAAPLAASAVPVAYHADLGELNDSGVTGSADLSIDQDLDQLTVEISASGLETGMGAVHPQHIHGRFTDGGAPRDSVSPDDSADTDSDGFVELNEAAGDYGPILVPLTSPPGGALTDFPTAEADGTLTFSQTYDLTDSTTFAPIGEDPSVRYSADDLMTLDLREIVLHGMSVAGGIGSGTEGEVNGDGGYLAVLPVATGEIEPVNAVSEVPEPATFALMLAGMGLLVGTGVARRSRSATTRDM